MAKAFGNGQWYHRSLALDLFWKDAYEQFKGTEYEEECLAGLLAGAE